MIKTSKRILISILLFLLVFININIYANDVTYFAGGRYYIDERLEENILPYGINHYKDKSYTSASETKEYRPQQVNVLEIPSNENIKITPWADITSTRWQLAPITKIISEYEKKNPGYKVVAAANGDFFDIDGEENFPYVPEGVHIANGNLYKSTNKSSANIVGFKNDGSNDPLVGNVEFKRSNNIYLDIYEKGKVIKQYPVDKINANPEDGEIALFYACYDENKKIVPQEITNGYIVEEAEYALPIADNDFYGIGTISFIGSATLSQGMFGVVSKSELVNKDLSLKTKIRVQFKAEGEFQNVNDAIGVREMFLYDGEYTGKDINTHPRTMVGMKADGTIVLTVVDGRQESNGMYGVQAIEMATIMTHYGAIEAYNLDGGGSSTMVIFKDGKHQVVNSPSGGYQRSDANGIMVAVKVPVIDYSVSNISDNSLTINANVIDMNGYQFDKLYVGLGNEIKEVKDGKATFTNLDSNREYVYTFYQKDGDNYKSLIVADTIMTAKITPQINYLFLSYQDDKLVIEADIYDPDKAISKNIAYLDNKFATLIDGKANFYNYDGDINNLYLKYTYDLQDSNGKKEITLTDYRFGCEFKILMKMSLNKLNQKLFNIYH